MVLSNRSLSVVPTAGSEVEWWQMAQQQAGMLVKTGFLPESIKTPEQAIAIMMKGRELGIPSMYALSNIVIIKGKPTCNSELMLALIYRDHGDGSIRIVESSNDVCQIAYRRPRWPKEQSYAFTVQDATRAGLMGGNTWKQYTAAMLRARCISAVARMAFPDSIAGMYTPDELGADVAMSDEQVEFIVSKPEPTTLTVVPAAVAIESGADMITAKQIAYIHVLKSKKGLTDAQIKTMHGQASAKLLTIQGAANFIGDLELLPDAEMAGAGTVPAPAYDAEFREVDEATGELLDSPQLFDTDNPDRFTR